jgi:flagellar motility protein MotE (MotC chaperone)
VSDADRDAAQADVDEQQRWGESLGDRALRRALAVIDRIRDRLVVLEDDRDAAKQAIQDLRARVKTLEDRAP